MIRINTHTLFYRTNQILYKILGPQRSVVLAHSWFGMLVLRLLKEQSSGRRKYYLDQGIVLSLTRKQALMLGIFHLGIMNPFETDLLKQILKPADIFLDVGAYVDGWYTIIASQLVGLQGHVYTFEPNPRVLMQLKQNIILNKCVSNTTVLPYALSDKNMRMTFFEGDMASSLYKFHADQNKAPRRSYKVTTMTLMHFLKKYKIGRVRLVKLDIEGAEYRVIKAAAAYLMSKDAPDLLIEVVDEFLKQANASEALLLKLLKDFGYIPYCLDNTGLHRYDLSTRRQRTLNLYFTKNHHVPR